MGGIGTAICQRLHQEGFKVIAGCGPTRDFTKWLDEQKALGFTFPDGRSQGHHKAAAVFFLEVLNRENVVEKSS
jgi:NAD(P)-dependent dehydrogenase (short-subunit alcohol dehydrogenase family)